MEKVQIGVFGGSGFYEFGKDIQEVNIDTPYGSPSHSIFIATIAGKRVAFLPRHGIPHTLPPHKINYRANVWAMKTLGVKQLFGPCACGSLDLNIKPGDFVFCDQFIDETKDRADTFYEGPVVMHVSCAEPYCKTLRSLAFEAAEKQGIPYHKTGTVVTINGPRYASRAESKDYSARGFHVINMTQYPEMILAREQEICYLNISLITDYDSGLEQAIGKTSAQDVLTVFHQNLSHVKTLLFNIIEAMPKDLECSCHHALENARVD